MGKAGGGKWRDSDFLTWELNLCFLSPTIELLDERGLPLKLSKGLKHLTAGKRSECQLLSEGIYIPTTQYKESKSLKQAQMLPVSYFRWFFCVAGDYMTTDIKYVPCQHTWQYGCHAFLSGWLGCTIQCLFQLPEASSLPELRRWWQKIIINSNNNDLFHFVAALYLLRYRES